jgi:hypothetical protein
VQIIVAFLKFSFILIFWHSKVLGIFITEKRPENIENPMLYVSPKESVMG